MVAARTYRIRVAGVIGRRICVLFAPLGMVASPAGRDTVLSGDLHQDDLVRVLALVRDLGLELVELEAEPVSRAH